MGDELSERYERLEPLDDTGELDLHRLYFNIEESGGGGSSQAGSSPLRPKGDGVAFSLARRAKGLGEEVKECAEERRLAAGRDGCGVASAPRYPMRLLRRPPLFLSASPPETGGSRGGGG